MDVSTCLEETMVDEKTLPFWFIMFHFYKLHHLYFLPSYKQEWVWHMNTTDVTLKSECQWCARDQMPPISLLFELNWLTMLTFSWKGLWPVGVVGKGHLSPLSYQDDSSALQPRGRRNLIERLRKPPGSPASGRKMDRYCRWVINRQKDRKKQTDRSW